MAGETREQQETEAPAELKRRIENASRTMADLTDGLNQVILGHQPLVRDVVTGVLAGGGMFCSKACPDWARPSLSRASRGFCRIQFRRVQFTPDLLPSDITGSFILEQRGDRREFVFQEGPVFTNVLLGDEINRASPKTQSALLEAMAERRVTVMGESRELPVPFFVLATQNPIELEGTYPLPEAQVDRFLFKLHLGQPPSEVLSDIARNRVAGAPPDLEPVLGLEDLRDAIAVAREIYISEPVAAYIARLVEATHPSANAAPDIVKRYVRYGASPRAAIGLASGIRARALMLGRPHAGFDSVRELFAPVMNHRLILDYSARVDGVGVEQIMDAILEAVDEYGKPLPQEVRPA